MLQDACTVRPPLPVCDSCLGGVGIFAGLRSARRDEDGRRLGLPPASWKAFSEALGLAESCGDRLKRFKEANGDLWLDLSLCGLGLASDRTGVVDMLICCLSDGKLLTRPSCCNVYCFLAVCSATDYLKATRKPMRKALADWTEKAYTTTVSCLATCLLCLQMPSRLGSRCVGGSCAG